MRIGLRLLVLLVSLAPGCSRTHESNPPRSEIHVAAASDLTPAFEEAAGLLTRSGQVRIVCSFGSSGMLAQQIEQGAPFDLFASANEGFIDRLRREGLVVEGSKEVFAQGSLIIWQQQDSGLQISGLKDLALPAVKRIAIANPEHAPYGLAARQALERAGLWELLKGKMVFGENVLQAWQFASTGNVEAAIVSRSLSSRPGGRAVPVDASLYPPIRQTLAIMKRTSNMGGCRQFIEFLRASSGRALLERHGFVVGAP